VKNYLTFTLKFSKKYIKKDEYKCIKNYMSSVCLFKFSIICSLVSMQKKYQNTQIYFEWCPQSFILESSCFWTSFQHIKSPKNTKLFLIKSHIYLYYNYHVLKPLWHEYHWKVNTNALEFYFSLFVFHIICCLISTNKITKINDDVLNDVFCGFIL
jgi:hypothetical protein